MSGRVKGSEAKKFHPEIITPGYNGITRQRYPVTPDIRALREGGDARYQGRYIQLS